MFLEIQKIGKDKHKFKAKIIFLKLYNPSTQKGICFKIKFQRGSHEIEAISEPSKKGTARFPTKEQIIPMTLFCRDEAKQIKYLKKDAKIKVYECDEQGNDIRKIGTKELDISEFAGKGKLRMQIQIDPSKKTDNPVLTLQVNLERQDDDSKSVATYSSNNDRNDVANKSDRDKVETNSTDQNNGNQKIKQKYKKNQDQTGNFLKDKDNTNNLQENKKSRLKQNNTKQTKQDDKVIKKVEQEQKFYESNNKLPKGFNYAINAKYSQQDQQRSQNQRTALLNKKNQVQTQFNDQQSPQLQAFLLKKALKQKQQQIYSLKKQNQAYKKTVQKLVEENSSTKDMQKRTGIQKQADQFKKMMTTKDIMIDQLNSQNKILTSRQQQYEKTILKLRQQISTNREKLIDIKYRQAYFMQEMFESGDKEALEQACRFMSFL